MLSAIDGLPIGIKDLIETIDMPTQMGCGAFIGNFPKRDSILVRALRDAGAVILGKSNLHELAFGITSTNFTLGRNADGSASKPCRNPYDKTRSPGGSSGGTAVAIAARFASAGLGTGPGSLGGSHTATQRFGGTRLLISESSMSSAVELVMFAHSGGG